jgi:hypothetical protein
VQIACNIEQFIDDLLCAGQVLPTKMKQPQSRERWRQVDRAFELPATSPARSKTAPTSTAPRPWTLISAGPSWDRMASSPRERSISGGWFSLRAKAFSVFLATIVAAVHRPPHDRKGQRVLEEFAGSLSLPRFESH